MNVFDVKFVSYCKYSFRSGQKCFIMLHFYRSILSLPVAMVVAMDAAIAETT